MDFSSDSFSSFPLANFPKVEKIVCSSLTDACETNFLMYFNPRRLFSKFVEWNDRNATLKLKDSIVSSILVSFDHRLKCSQQVLNQLSDFHKHSFLIFFQILSCPFQQIGKHNFRHRIQPRFYERRFKIMKHLKKKQKNLMKGCQIWCLLFFYIHKWFDK